jgi:hypothetical protein
VAAVAKMKDRLRSMGVLGATVKAGEEILLSPPPIPFPDFHGSINADHDEETPCLDGRAASDEVEGISVEESFYFESELEVSAILPIKNIEFSPRYTEGKINKNSNMTDMSDRDLIKTQVLKDLYQQQESQLRLKAAHCKEIIRY